MKKRKIYAKKQKFAIHLIIDMLEKLGLTIIYKMWRLCDALPSLQCENGCIRSWGKYQSNMEMSYIIKFSLCVCVSVCVCMFVQNRLSLWWWSFCRWLSGSGVRSPTKFYFKKRYSWGKIAPDIKNPVWGSPSLSKSYALIWFYMPAASE